MRLQRASRVFLWVVIVGAVVAALLAIAQDQHTIRIRASVEAGDPQSPAYLAALVGSPVSTGNTYEVLTNGDQIFPAMLAAIDGATRRVSFETYVYKKGKVAGDFTGALARAARRGVAVHVVLDTFGSSDIDEEVARLRSAGAHVVTFNPPRWYSLEEVNYRTHRKILVVDGRSAFTGGVGVADYWIGDAQDEDHWRDTQIRLDGPIARLIEAAFYEDLIEAGEIVTPVLESDTSDSVRHAGSEGNAPPSSPDLQDGGRALIVRSSASGGANDLKRLYLLMIASARRTLEITSPYFVTDESTTWALQDAVSRGVKVRLLLEGDKTDAKPVKDASRAQYRRLLESGIAIHEYQPTMMHAKTMVADGIWSMFGSANFDNRSLELNDELNVAVHSPRLAARLLRDFEEDLRRARRIDASSWERRPALQKAREKFWSYFGEVF